MPNKVKGMGKVRNYEKPKLGHVRWHFWFLIIITFLAFWVGYQSKDLYTGIIFGIFVYVLPILISLRYKFDLTKSDIKRFYLP